MKLKFDPFLAARFTSRAPVRVARAMSAIALMAAGSSNAAPCIWIGNTDANWNTLENWDFLPGSTDDLVFEAAGTAGTTLNNDLTNAAFIIAGITFNSAAPAYTISGGDFTLSNGITNNSANLQTINDAIILSDANIFTTPGGGGIALGAVRTAVGSSFDVASATPLTLASLNGGAVNNNRVNVTSAGNLTVTGSFHVNNNVAGAGSFTQTAGTVTLSSAADAVTFGDGISLAFRAAAGTQNTYALQGGTLNAPNASFYVSSGGGANGLLSITGGTANLRGITLSGTSASAVGAVSLTGGRLNLGANGLVRNGTTMAGSTVTLGAGTLGALADWSSALLPLPTNMILSDLATGVTIDTLDAADGVTPRTITLPGVLSGTGSMVKAGAGTLTLSGLNTYSGNTAVNAGTLILADNAKLTFVLGATSGASNSISGAGTVILDGDFGIDTTAASALTSGSWTLENVPSLSGAYGATFTVLNGFADVGGNKWTKTDGSKLWTFDETTGVLTLAAASGYGTWAAVNAIGQTPGQDKDNDGVSNGLEYVLGGGVTTNDAGKLPAVAATGGNLTFTFLRNQASKTADIAVKVEVGSTLLAWPSSFTVGNDTAGSSPGVTVVDQLNGKDMVTLTVAQSPDAKKFARLQIIVTP